MAEKNPGKGTQLKHGVGTGPTVYTSIAQRTKINGPDGKVGSVDVTDLDSAAKEYRPTLYDGGEVSMDIWYDPTTTTHKLLTGLLTAPTVDKWEITFADAAATPVTFDAFLTEFTPGGMEPEGYLMASIKLKITGAPIWPT